MHNFTGTHNRVSSKTSAGVSDDGQKTHVSSKGNQTFRQVPKTQMIMKKVLP